MRLKLPHLNPIRFAQELISLNDMECSVLAKFPHPPTLAMIVEAAAQSCAGFAEDKKEPSIAFLVMLKEINLEKKCTSTSLKITLNAKEQMGVIRYFFFVANDGDNSIANGSFAIAIP